jgi:hypothetical protein
MRREKLTVVGLLTLIVAARLYPLKHARFNR